MCTKIEDISTAANLSTFERNKLSPSSESSIEQSCHCYLFDVGFFLGLFWTQKMEVTCYPEISLDFQRNALYFIQEDRTLHKHCSENLKSCNVEEMLLSHSQTADKDMDRDEAQNLRNVGTKSQAHSGTSQK